MNMDTNINYCLAHSSVQHLIVNVTKTTNQFNFIEACIIEIRLTGNDLLIFACIYRSPTKSDTSNENNIRLNKLIYDISSSKKYSHKCFVGDFNFPTINWENWTTKMSKKAKRTNSWILSATHFSTRM